MRDMSHKEILKFISHWSWGTLIGVEGDRPYAVELSYGTDGEYIYCGSKPGGRMARCISGNRNVIFKICDAAPNSSRYRAVTIEGTAERVTDYEGILTAVRAIASNMGLHLKAFDSVAERTCNNPESNSLRIPMEKVSGVTSGYFF